MCAYNPGVADRSGEILANGLNNTVSVFARDMDQMRENERKRRTAAGQVQGILAANPQLAQKVDPTLLGKMSSGKAKLNDTLELLGTLSTVQQQEQEALQQQVRQVQMQAALAQISGQQQQQQRNAQMAPVEDELQALRIQNERQRQRRMEIEIEQALNAKPFQPSMVGMVDPATGQPVSALMTSPNSAVPLSRGAPAPKPGMGGIETIDVPGVGAIVIDKVTREPISTSRIVRPQSNGGSNINPLLIGTLTQQIQKLEAEKLQHEQEIVKGDERTGFLNTKSRKARLQEIEQQIAGLKATLSAGAKGGATPAPTPASAAPVPEAKADEVGKPALPLRDLDWYRKNTTAQDVQAELRRRGMIP